MRNSRTGDAFDTACHARWVPLPNAEQVAYHVTRLAPYVSTTPSGESIVHHMDVFLCDQRMAEPNDDQCIFNSWVGNSGPCYAMVWAYDRGALRAHDLPADSGFRVGAGTRYQGILVQIHYQLNLDKGMTADSLARSGYKDTSGVVATLTTQPPSIDAWSFEFMDQNMNIPIAARQYEYRSVFPAPAVADLLGYDIAAAPNQTLHLRQIHAHAHSHATRVSLHRTRNGVTETLFEIDPYCGYGGCQQFQPILDAPTLRDGDALEFRCLYDNDETLALGYGLSRGEEMCGPIIIYTPHDSRSVPRVSWHDGHYGEYRMPGGVWARVKGMLPLNKDGPHRSR